MRTAQEIADKYAEDQMVSAMLEYGSEVVDRCIEVIEEHCNQARERGMIASPGVMVMLLKRIKEEMI